MQQLLENEGIEIEENKVKNFDIIFWDPNMNLPSFNTNKFLEII